MIATERPTRNLSLDLLRSTEAAALAAARWVGLGNKNDGDGAAVDAMRLLLGSVPMRATVVIGEGEKDKAPMLYNGEKLGLGEGPEMDIAVDPIEGTRLVAHGRPGAISVIAAAERGGLFNPGPAFYAAKIVVGAQARAVVDLRETPEKNLREIAKALGKRVRELTIYVLDKPRHARLIDQIRTAGARVSLHTDGDMAGALAAVLPNSGIDALMGTGGTPEGIISAVAVKALGGSMQMRLDPQSEEEQWNLVNSDYDTTRIYDLSDICPAEDTHFAVTGITDGQFLRGVRYAHDTAVTHSLVIRGHTRTVRYIESHHQLDKLRSISGDLY